MTTDTIHSSATRLWQLMNDGTTWCYDRIRRATHMPDREINAALGWLAREETIEITADPATAEERYKIRPFWEQDAVALPDREPDSAIWLS